jgi:hypothetical protein
MPGEAFTIPLELSLKAVVGRLEMVPISKFGEITGFLLIIHTKRCPLSRLITTTVGLRISSTLMGTAGTLIP